MMRRAEDEMCMFYWKWILLATITLACIACGAKRLYSSGINLRSSVIDATPTPSDFRDRYVRDEGWYIPLTSARAGAKTKEVKLAGDDGRSVTCVVYSYSPSEELLTDEPFNSIGRLDYGKIKITFITEMKAKGKVFSYIFLAHKTQVDNQTGRLVETGPGFSFRYFDMDGDSKFETLSFRDAAGALPDWIFR